MQEGRHSEEYVILLGDAESMQGTDGCGMETTPCGGPEDETPSRRRGTVTILASEDATRHLRGTGTR
jgi:hypothetical protein